MKRQLTEGERYYLFGCMIFARDAEEFNYYYRFLTGRNGKGVWCLMNNKKNV